MRWGPLVPIPEALTLLRAALGSTQTTEQRDRTEAAIADLELARRNPEVRALLHFPAEEREQARAAHRAENRTDSV
jgi:hypothetical protein